VEPESGKMGWERVGVVTGIETLEPGVVTPREVMYIQYLRLLDFAEIFREGNLPRISIGG
jgi:hypothetical protein